jgi:hypothetical protein
MFVRLSHMGERWCDECLGGTRRVATWLSLCVSCVGDCVMDRCHGDGTGEGVCLQKRPSNMFAFRRGRTSGTWNIGQFRHVTRHHGIYSNGASRSIANDDGERRNVVGRRGEVLLAGGHSATFDVENLCPRLERMQG